MRACAPKCVEMTGTCTASCTPGIDLAPVVHPPIVLRMHGGTAGRDALELLADLRELDAIFICNFLRAKRIYGWRCCLPAAKKKHD